MDILKGIMSALNVGVVRPAPYQEAPPVPDQPRYSVVSGRETPANLDRFPACPYDLTNAPFQRWTYNTGEVLTHYFLEGKNIDRAYADIGSLNGCIEFAESTAPTFPIGLQIMSLQTTPTNDGRGHCTTLEFAPVTAAGRAAKYPLSIRFQTIPWELWSRSRGMVDNVHGEVSYGADGKVAKARIHCSREIHRFSIECAKRDGELRVSYIKTAGDRAQEIRLYDYRADGAEH